MLKKEAITKLQAVILAVIIIVAVVAGVAYYYMTTPSPTPTPSPTATPTVAPTATPTVAPTATPSPTATPTAIPTMTISLGFSMPLSGAQAYNGEMVKRGYEFAVKDINDAGGVYVPGLGKKLMLKLVYYDDESDATKAKTNVERLITVDGVDFLMGSFSSPICFAVATVAETYKIVHLAVGFGSIPCETNNYNWTFIPYHTELHNSLSMLTFLNESLPGPGPYKIALWAEDSPLGAFFSQGVVDTTAEFAPKFTMVLNEKYTTGQTDYSSLILKTKDANPDMVFGIPSTPDAITLIRNSKSLGLFPKVLFFERGSEPPEFWSLLGTDAHAVIGVMTGHPKLPIAANLQLTQEYEAQYGEMPGLIFPAGYSAVQVLMAAIVKAGTLDQEKVREALTTLDVNTVVGELRFAGPGHCDPLVRPGAYLEQVVHQWQDGINEIVWPAKYATAPFIYPRPTS